jgi:signal transduction histidine kinase
MIFLVILFLPALALSQAERASFVSDLERCEDYRELLRPDLALELALNNLSLLEESGQKELLFEFQKEQTIALLDLDLVLEAYTACREYSEQHLASGDSANYMAFRSLLANVQSSLGEEELSSELHFDVYDFRKRNGITEEFHESLLNVSQQFYFDDDLESCIHYLAEAKKFAIENDDQNAYARILNNEVIRLIQFEDSSNADVYSRRSEVPDLIEGLYDVAIAQDNLKALINYYQLHAFYQSEVKGNLDSSALFYLEIGSILDTVHVHAASRMVHIYNVGLAYMRLDEEKKAWRYFDETISMMDSTESDLARFSTLGLLRRMYAVYGDRDTTAMLLTRTKYRDIVDGYYNDGSAIRRQELAAALQTNEINEKRIRAQGMAADRLKGIFALVLALLGLGVLFGLYSRRKEKALESARKQTQHALQELQDQDSLILNAALEGSDHERERIARELHDQLGGMLSGVRLQVENNLDSEKRLVGVAVLELKESLDNSIQVVRKLAYDMSDKALEKLGLIAQLNSLFGNLSKNTHLKFELTQFGYTGKLSNKKELAVYRVIQEGLTNIIKHAEAKTVSLSITERDEEINFILEDDGKGFDPLKVNLDGLGLSSMRTRMEQIGGTLSIDTAPGRGSILDISVPFQKTES